jgi:hypothetical protein
MIIRVLQVRTKRRIKMEYNYYIDESGNTGTDWFNFDQPYFVYGGWLIPKDKTNEVEKYLKGLLSKTQAPELKSKNFYKRKYAMSDFYDIYFKMINEYSALPVLGITNKKFMIAAKIVETFFDGVYNPFVNGYLSYPVEVKKALASCIYQDNKILEDFSKIIKKCDASINEMNNINQQLVNFFVSNGLTMVAETLTGLSDENFNDMIGEFRTVSKDGKRKSFLTLTISGLVDLLRNIEFYCASKNVNVEVIHDELHGYRDSFNELESIFLRDQEPRVFEINNFCFLSNYPHIKSIEMINSKSDLMLQVTDLLCGFISNTFQLFDNGKPINSYIKKILSSIIKSDDKGLLTFNCYAPYDEIEQKIISSLKPKDRIPKTDYIELIKREFPRAMGDSFSEYI